MKLHLLYIGDAWLSNSSLELLAVCTSFEKAVELAVEHSKNVLPDTIGLSDNEDEFFITFATYCEAPTSNNGENIYTDTLIDILEYLENYRSTL